MATGVVSWSTTAATNATADANVNWAEGQAPSSVNDSARAMMASVAKWRDDNNGSTTTGGGTTNYTFTSNQGFGTLAALHRQSLRILWSVTCAASPTLNVDGLGAKNLVSTVGVNIGVGVLLANCVYDVVYDNNNSVFIVCGSPQAFPSGTIMLFVQTAAPTGWTKLTATDDASLRVTTGTASSGGTANFTTVFAARTIAQANLPNATLSATPNTASQTLTHQSAGNTSFTVNSAAVGNQATNTTNNISVYVVSQHNAITDHSVTFPNYTTASINGGVGQTAMDFAVKYIDVILAQKA